MIRTWVIDTEEFGAIARHQAEWLDESDRMMAQALRWGSDRRTFALGRILLRTALSEVFGREPEVWRFERERSGKLRLAPECGLPDVELSLSHSDSAIAVVLSTEGPVGIDIERIASFASRLEGVFTSEESGFLEAIADPLKRQSETARLWTSKEAYFKLLGEIRALDPEKIGLVPPPREIHFDSREIRVGDHPYRIAIAAQRKFLKAPPRVAFAQSV